MITRQRRNNQDGQPFDALAYEEERYQIFQKTETTQVPSEAYCNGDWDARLSIEPTCQNWEDNSYRQGYLDGITQKYDEKFGILI